jgi:hypothetical protein
MHRFSSIVLILVLGLFAGWFSARQMLDRAAGSTSLPANNWREVRISGDSLWSSYQSGHYLWRGKLQPATDVRLFRRDADDDGNALRSDCTTLIEGQSPQARWWMIGADNGNEVKTISSGTIIREYDNAFTVTVSQNAAPGNWLGLTGSRDYVIYLALNDARDEAAKTPSLPRVKRLWC